MEKFGNRFKDLTNQKFGKLTAISPVKMNGRYSWNCVCECGKEKIIMSGNLVRGISKTCGCGKIDIGNKTKKHGMAKTRMFKIWVGVKKRCTNPNTKTYKLYGGRGISMASEWNDFINFYNDMKDTYSDSLSLDRIDPNGNYEVSNCRWASSKQQNRNRRNNRIIECNGVSKTLAEWAETSGVSSSLILSRVNNGWDSHRAIYTMPKSSMKSISKYLVF